ncbi:MAG: hypothetical protein GX868_13565 [Actinobacteria bacterium]|nr:hypothetical protein [Actinomycetota bacterium]
MGFVHDASSVTPVVTEQLSPEEALGLALSMAPVVDLGASNEDSSDLPRTISFLAMDGYEAMADHPETVLERWTQNHSILTGPLACEPHRKAASLRAAVGAAPNTEFLLISAGNVDDETHAATHIRSGAPSRVTVWTVAGSGHTQKLDTQPDEWRRQVIGFLDQHLG